MSYVEYNPNPNGTKVGDCCIRAITKVLGNTWKETYLGVAMVGYELCDMPSSNYVWGRYLQDKGYKQYSIPKSYMERVTVNRFCEEHPIGTYVLGTGTHAIAVINGDYFDSWDSGDEIVTYCWQKGDRL